MNYNRLRSAVLMAGVLSAGMLHAQAPTSQDKDFVKDTAEDSNFEIRTAQLALTKSSSADVKAYAHMLITDHTALNRETRKVDTTASIEPVKSGSMSLTDDAEYAKLKILSGKTFEDSYIKGLNRGNEESINKAKSEASESSIPAIKHLAEHRAQLDTKHAEKAKQLAAAHGVDTK